MRYIKKFFNCIFWASALFTPGCNENKEDKSNEEALSDTSINKNKTTTEMHAGFDTSKSVTRISPNLYKQLADTLGIRMIEGTYQPGDSSIMHAHPDFALYVLEGSMVELTMEDGSKQNIDFVKDMAVILPSVTHSARNIGKSRLKLIVVEVNRPRS